MNAPILTVEHVSKAFGGIQAVQDCSFEVRAGLITGLIGPNGAGKTTIFNLITGFLRADSGSIRCAAKSCAGCCRIKWRLRVWCAPSSICDCGQDDVLENVLLGCRTPLGESLFSLFLKAAACARRKRRRMPARWKS
jgi:ABC-type branched-subunit amino acid transport system ATPase component